MKTLISALLCMVSFLAVAQESETKQSIGVNGTQFIANYLNFGGFVNSNNPYMILYTRDMGPGHLRAGANLFMRQTDDNRNPNMRADEKVSQLNLRVGYGFSKPLGKRFNLLYGADIFYGNGQNYRSTEMQVWTQNGLVRMVQISENNSQQYGAGLIGAIDFSLGERVRLYTESRLYAHYEEREQGIKWQGEGSDQFTDNVNKSFDKQLQLFLPLDIFIQLQF